MGEEACRDCGSWEEQIYWTRFQYIRFFMLLRPGFDQHLALPEQFSKNLKAKLPEKVTLSGPSGVGWDVELTTIGDTMFFCHGWEAFVKDHALKEKDLLVFKYNGDSGFDVRMFDSHSSCEKSSAYFVRKCRHIGKDRGSEVKRKLFDSCLDDSLASDQDADEGTTADKLAENEIIESPGGQQSMLQSMNKKARRDNEATKSDGACWTGRNGAPLIYDEVDVKPGLGHGQCVQNSTPYVSMRLVSEEKKQNALQLAQSAISSKGFTVIMKPSHVRKGYMALPTAWIHTYFPSLDKQDVILRINENTWVAKFSYRIMEKRGGLARGWKNFAMDNRLQESDVCAFEPAATPVNEPVVLDVSIFRVAEGNPVTMASF